MNNMDDTEVVVISDDEVVVLPAGAEDEEEHLDLNQIVIDNIISSSGPPKTYTLLETRLHPSTNLTDSPLNSVIFEECHSLADFYENCKNKKEYPLSGVGSSITLAPKRLVEEDVTKAHGNVTKFWYLCLRLVTKHGHHITSLEVKVANGVEFPTMFWTVTNKLLRFLPNLRSLFIEASFKQFGHPSGCGGGNMLLPQSNSIDGVKCPSSLTKLSCLSIRFVETNVLTKLMTSKLLEAYGTQLRKLSVTHVTFDMIDKGNLDKLRNLMEFNLFWWRSGGGGLGGNNNQEVEDNLQCLQRVRTSVLFKLDGMKAPGLEKLRVMLNNTGFATVKHPTYLFKLLGKFPKLKLLNLSGIQFDPDHPGGKENGVGRWEDLEWNGVLECLKFKDRRDISHDFLEKLKGLEALFIEGASHYWLMDKKEGEEEDERIIKLQEYLYGKQVFKSNIWEKMPSLRMIGVQLVPGGEDAKGRGGGVEETAEIYTRDMYECETEERDELGFY